MLGCCLGVCYAYGLFKPRHYRLVGLAAPAAVVVGCATIVTQRTLSTLFPGLLILELATAIVLLAALTNSSRIVGAGLSSRPLVGLGKISYGVYVWHDLFLGWMAPYLVIPIVLIVAMLSYGYIEKPFLRRKDSPQPLLHKAAVATQSAG